MSNYKHNDLYWTSIGDLDIDEVGDVRDTSKSSLRSLVQEIKTRLSALRGSWKVYPGLGAGLHDFVGKRNIPEVGKAMENQIIDELTHDNLVLSGDLYVRAVPISKETIMTRIRVDVTGTDATSEGQITLSYLFDINKIGPLYAG